MSTTLLVSGYAWACLAGLFAIALLNSWTSRINQFFFFSRTVEPGFSGTSAARAITARYLLSVWLGFALALFLYAALLFFTNFSERLCFTLALIPEIITVHIAYARAHRVAGEAIIHASTIGEPARVGNPVNGVVAVPLLAPLVFSKKLVTLLFLAPVFAALVWLLSMYATHLGFDAFSSAVEANKADFLGGLGMGMMFAGLMVYILLRYFSRHRSPMGFLTANLMVLCAWIGAALLAASALAVPLRYSISRTSHHLILGALLAFAILRMLYGWSRNRFFPPAQAEINGDAFWRWGLFYYNPADPTLFIQSRCGHGYTVNFANFISWPLVFFMLADLAFIVGMHIRR